MLKKKKGASRQDTVGMGQHHYSKSKALARWVSWMEVYGELSVGCQPRAPALIKVSAGNGFNTHSLVPGLKWQQPGPVYSALSTCPLPVAGLCVVRWQSHTVYMVAAF